MEVLIINGSPHPQGTTAAGISIIADEFVKKNVVSNIWQVGDKQVRGCIGCRACGNSDKRQCVFNDDIVNKVIEKAKSADGIILACPVYYSGIPGNMKAFLDRFFQAGSKNLHYKVGASVVFLRRSGGVDTFHQLNSYFSVANIIITPSHYWNAVYATNGDEVLKDNDGVEILKAISTKMAWLMEVIGKGGQNISLPIKEQHIKHTR